MQSGVGPAAAGVLAEQEVARDLASGHAVEVRELRVVAVHARQPREGEVVLRRGGVAVPGLELADDELGEVRPVAGEQALVIDVGAQRLMLFVGRRLRQIAGQHVVQGREVGRALYGGVAAHGHDPAAGPAHVPEQQLQDAGGADHLHADGVLGPPQRVDDSAGPLATGVGAQQLRHPHQLARGAAAHLGDDLRCVPGEVAFEDLEDAARVLQRRVVRRRSVRRCGHVLPRRGVAGSSRLEVVTLNPVFSLQHLRPGRLTTRRGITAHATLVAPVSLYGVVLAGLSVPAVAAE